MTPYSIMLLGLVRIYSYWTPMLRFLAWRESISKQVEDPVLTEGIVPVNMGSGLIIPIVLILTICIL